jgi:hypothetical protein
VNGRTNLGRNAQILKGLSLLYVVLVILSLFFVHSESYRPAVSYVLLYLAASVIFTAAIAALLLPARQFGEGLCTASTYSTQCFWRGRYSLPAGNQASCTCSSSRSSFAAALHGFAGGWGSRCWRQCW